MGSITAKPTLLKQANLTLIRQVVKRNGTATRADIARITNISPTTVRSLLSDMLRNGEIESVGYDASSGGRKAERYRLVPDRYYGAAVCITDSRAHGLVVNVCGEIVETRELDMSGRHLEQAVTTFLDSLAGQREIKAIGLGVPGVVEGDAYWRKDPQTDQWCATDIGRVLAQRYGLPVVMENDLNATAIGYGHGLERDMRSIDLTYLHFEKGCVSAGLLAEGRVIRGCRQYAGELGLIPVEEGKRLDDILSGPLDDADYTQRVVTVLGWICGMLNPQVVVLAGPALRKECLETICHGIAALPAPMRAEIRYSPDVWRDYHTGMAYLTAGHMFDEIQFIQESLD